MNPMHRDLAAGRWWELTLSQQRGNVGSEVSRTLQWRDRDPEISRRAFARCLDLLDLTRADPRHVRSVSRLREIARTREVLVDYFAGSNTYGSTALSLQRYFDAFALAAARGR